MKLPAVLNNEKGVVLVLVITIGVITLIIFANILPQLHMGQQVLALTRLNDYRAYWAAKKGLDVTEIGMNNSGNFQELIASNDGIIQSFIDIFGTSVAPKHIEYKYWDESSSSAEYQFISNCLHIDESINPILLHEKGDMHVAIIVLRGTGAGLLSSKITPTYVAGERSGVADDEEDDLIYFYDSASSQWISVDNDNGDWNKFAYYDGVKNIWYCDFDLDTPDTPVATDAEQKADFIFSYDDTNEDWYFSIGNNGSFRKKDNDAGTTQLWDIKKRSVNIADPFQGNDNDGDGIAYASDDNDKVEIFIIVRSTGIIVAPGSNYNGTTNVTDLKLINDPSDPNEKSHLPNPMRQVIEAGFYLYTGTGLEVKQFYFGKATNLKEDNES